MKQNKYNKYDYGIIVLILLIAFGGIGGTLSPLRCVALFFSPWVWLNIFTRPLNKALRFVCYFFLIWFIYSLCSLVWTSALVEGLKELLYYYCHFSLFFLFVLWLQKARFPLVSIILGWVGLILCTLPIAFNEIFNDQHLYLTLHDHLSMNVDGQTLDRKYASVTFGNYNSYVTVICFALPFMFAYLLLVDGVKKQLWGWFIVLAVFYILVINASRGGLLCFVIALFSFLLFYRKKHYRGKRWILFLIISGVCIGLWLNFDVIFQQILYRIGEDSLSEAMQDNSRSMLIWLSLGLFLDSYCLGTGIGSISASLAKVSPSYTIPHNLFVEILVQYGFVILGFFLFFLFLLYTKGRKTTDRLSKFIIYTSLWTIPFASVINSHYLLIPELWIYYASLFIFLLPISSIEYD